MDDMTTITTTNACTKRLLDKLQGNIRWARMDIKPSKSQRSSSSTGERYEAKSYTKRLQKELTTGPQTLIVGDGAVNKTKHFFSKNTKVLCFTNDMVSDISQKILEITAEHPTVKSLVIHTGALDVVKQQSEVLKQDFNDLLNKVRYQWTSTNSSARRREIQQAVDAKQMAQRYGQLTNLRFHIHDEPIPTILEKPIKSLGRWYYPGLKDAEQVEQLRQDTISGLKQINTTALPGKLKLWCFQFGLLPRLMWPISIYEVTLSHAKRLERLVNVQVRKWLGLPRCLSSIGLYGNGALSLPISSLVEEYKCSKARLEMTLTESRDPVVTGAAPTLATGRRWKPSAAVAQAKSALRHRDIVGQVQHGRGGLAERRRLVVEEVRHQEEADKSARAVSQAKQGRWMKWDGVERRKITWSELWNMESNMLSFTIRATYDVLPTPANLHLWFGEDPACLQCLAPATLKHILVGCKTSLTQGRYTWRHNQVLKCLAAALESKRVITNAKPPEAQTTFWQPASFIRKGEKQLTNRSPADSCPLNAARDWEMRVDLNQRLTFPPEIAATNLRPDLVLWSKTCRRVFIMELTVPWEEAIDEAFERKQLRYVNLTAEAEDQDWLQGLRSQFNLKATKRGWNKRTGSVEDHQRARNCCGKKQPLAVAEAEGDGMGCQVTSWSLQHDTHHRPDQPVVGQPRARVYCDKRPKHPMRPGCTTDDVSYWRHQAVLAPVQTLTQEDISINSVVLIS
ncbi:hypothetical protein N1851_012273 [Merluccius polli]|uniref:Reverse transcriptase zinc-binding domain-containing protein n=1 Tax=Merluccius polli TaxID=89951 RepID=A0AA47MXD4_MERPO|nr:hypothetical protein N1851_012273 [Merluccius polli]